MKQHQCFLRERVLARAQKHDIGVERDHGIMFIWGGFNYDGSGAQGWGMIPNMEFVRRLLDVFGAEKLSQIEHKPCWVTHCQDRIHLVEPLFAKEGEAFDVDAWVEDGRKAAA